MNNAPQGGNISYREHARDALSDVRTAYALADALPDTAHAENIRAFLTNAEKLLGFIIHSSE